MVKLNDISYSWVLLNLRKRNRWDRIVKDWMKLEDKNETNLTKIKWNWIRQSKKTRFIWIQFKSIILN